MVVADTSATTLDATASRSLGVPEENNKRAVETILTTLVGVSEPWSTLCSQVRVLDQKQERDRQANVYAAVRQHAFELLVNNDSKGLVEELLVSAQDVFDAHSQPSEHEDAVRLVLALHHLWHTFTPRETSHWATLLDNCIAQDEYAAAAVLGLALGTLIDQASLALASESLATIQHRMDHDNEDPETVLDSRGPHVPRCCECNEPTRGSQLCGQTRCYTSG